MKTDLSPTLLAVIGTALAVVCVLLLVHFIRKAIHAKWYEEVLATSEALKRLTDLNERQRFYTDVKSEYPYKAVLDTKPKFDRFDFDRYFYQILEHQTATFSYLHRHLRDNQIKWGAYKDLYAQIRENHFAKNTGTVPDDFYRRVEAQAFEQKILHPVVTSEIVITASYTSPQGRKWYQNSRRYSLEMVSEALKKIQAQKEYEQSEQARRKRERVKMTPSLRYDVLKRDSFRCRICGRTQSDGVKLHVDHIVPVSKGGQTVLSNLQTLCDQCNLGKSNKYDREYREDEVIRGIRDEIAKD